MKPTGCKHGLPGGWCAICSGKARQGEPSGFIKRLAEREVRMKSKGGSVRVLPEGGQRLSFNEPFGTDRGLRVQTWAKPTEGGLWNNPKYLPDGLQRFAVTLRGRLRGEDGTFPLLEERIEVAQDMDELVARFQRGPDRSLNISIKRLL